MMKPFKALKPMKAMKPLGSLNVGNSINKMLGKTTISKDKFSRNKENISKAHPMIQVAFGKQFNEQERKQNYAPGAYDDYRKEILKAVKKGDDDKLFYEGEHIGMSLQAGEITQDEYRKLDKLFRTKK